MNNEVEIKSDETKSAFKKANIYMSYRPRSESEVENKLSLMFNKNNS